MAWCQSRHAREEVTTYLVRLLISFVLMTVMITASHSSSDTVVMAPVKSSSTSMAILQQHCCSLQGERDGLINRVAFSERQISKLRSITLKLETEIANLLDELEERQLLHTQIESVQVDRLQAEITRLKLVIKGNESRQHEMQVPFSDCGVGLGAF